MTTEAALLEEHHVRWFGEGWGAPINDPKWKVSVPDRTPCMGCDCPILRVERGVALYGGGLKFDDPHLFLVRAQGGEQPQYLERGNVALCAYHVDCFVFGIFGKDVDSIDRVNPSMVTTRRKMR